MMEIQECIFPLSVCVADITVTGCEVRKQVRPSFLQPPHWPGRDSGMSADCLNRRLSAGGDMKRVRAPVREKNRAEAERNKTSLKAEELELNHRRSREDVFFVCVCSFLNFFIC